MSAPNTGNAEAPPRTCGLGRRLLIMAYDAIAVIAVLMLATALAMALGFREPLAGRDPLFSAYLLATWFGYLGWCWRRGMTLGMRAWRVRLVSEDGARPGWARCGLRFLVSLASAAAAGAGYWWALFDPARRTWHDRASGTTLRRI